MHIAVVEDEAEYSEYLARLISRSGHVCATFSTGASLLAEVRRETFDLILLDWNLPDILGIDLLKSIRSSQPSSIATIMLTSRNDKQDMTAALNAGADDYIVKPESPEVILARIDAVLRRSQPEAAERFYVVDDYEFDQLSSTVTYRGERVTLSVKEFQLALLLFQNPHRALSRNYLMEAIWQSVPDLPSRTLDMHISKIRSKLQLRPENGYRIVALSGYGYRMERFSADVRLAAS